MRLAIAAIAAMALGARVPAAAQQERTALRERVETLRERAGDTLIVMTVPLKHLSSQDAVMLLQPYATAGGSGVAGRSDAPDSSMVAGSLISGSHLAARMLEVLAHAVAEHRQIQPPSTPILWAHVHGLALRVVFVERL